MFAIYPILIICVIPEQWRSSFWTLAILFFSYYYLDARFLLRYVWVIGGWRREERLAKTVTTELQKPVSLYTLAQPSTRHCTRRLLPPATWRNVGSDQMSTRGEAKRWQLVRVSCIYRRCTRYQLISRVRTNPRKTWNLSHILHARKDLESGRAPGKSWKCE